MCLYVGRVKCIHMGTLVYAVLFCGSQGRDIVYFDQKEDD